MTPAIRMLERGDAPAATSTPVDPLGSVPTATPATADVRGVLDRAVWTGPHTEARITVVCEATSANVDPTILQQVVVHLLHLEDELPEGTSVWVTAVEASGGLVVTVEDDAATGSVPGDASPAGVTAPLRLARVCQLARRHGGEMWIEDAPGGGLCYVVTLPALPAP